MKNTKLDDAEAVKQVVGSFSELDNQRVVELKQLNDTQQLRGMMMEKESKRLAAKYGEDHPRVLQLQRKTAVLPAVQQGIDGQVSLASMPSDPLPLNGWRIRGRALDQDGKTIEGITVYFADEKHQWIRELGNSCSDKNGAYILTLDEKMVKQVGDRSVFLAASDKLQSEVYYNKEAYHPKNGVEEFKDIGIGGEYCVDPPTKPVTPPKPTNPVDTKPTPDKGTTEGNATKGKQPEVTGNKENKTWTVKGTVRRKTKRASASFPGVTVRITDRGKKFAKLLGEKVADRKGAFEFVYELKNLTELVKADPPLFVMVFDPSGKQLYTSQDPIHCKAGNVEELKIVI
ncbi:MAG TPA: hypothetical protein VKA08_15700 [Balneolales bacterium]|nr:hypothetical protein [Balneolales bacterium]